MVERLRTRGARRWEGMPGVQYPPVDTRPEPRHRRKKLAELPSPQAWIPTDGAAAALHLSQGRTRQKLAQLRVPSLEARGRVYWCRREVAALAGQRDYLEAAPQGWLLTEDALVCLGCTRSSLLRFEQKGRLRTRKALVGSKRRTLFHEEDVAELARLLRQEKETAAALSAWR